LNHAYHPKPYGKISINKVRDYKAVTLCHDWFVQFDALLLLAHNSYNLLVVLLVELNTLRVVEHAQQMCLEVVGGGTGLDPLEGLALSAVWMAMVRWGYRAGLYTLGTWSADPCRDT